MQVGCGLADVDTDDGASGAAWAGIREEALITTEMERQKLLSAGGAWITRDARP
jgi:hypothetical protein